jgi:hypothetical protein
MWLYSNCNARFDLSDHGTSEASRPLQQDVHSTAAKTDSH